MLFNFPLYAFSGGTFDPATLPLRGWWRANFTAVPWFDQPSATIPITLSEGITTAPTAGSAVNGYAPVDFNGIDQGLTTISTIFSGALISSLQYYYAFVVKPRNPVADTGAINNPPLHTDTGSNYGVSYSDVGMTAFQYDTTTGWVEVDVACSADNWHFVQVWHDGVDLHCQVDNTAGTPISVPMTWLNTYIEAMIPYLATNGAGALYFDGQVLATVFSQSALDAPTRNGIGSFFQTRYGLNFGLSAPPVNPTRVNLTGLWMDSFSVTPWTGTHNTNLKLGIAPTTGAPINSLTPANFNGGEYLDTDFIMSSYTNDSSGSGWVFFNAETTAAQAAPGLRVGDQGLFVQASGATTWGITYSNNGVCHLLYDGAYKELVVYAGLGNYHLAQFKWNGTNIYLRVDRGPWVAFAAGNCDTTPTSGFLRAGANYAPSAFFDGDIVDCAITDQVLSDTDFDKLVSYFESRYATSLNTIASPYGMTLSGWWGPNFTAGFWASSPTQGPSNARAIDTVGEDPVAGTALNGYVPFSFEAADSLQSSTFVWSDLIEPLLSETGSIFILFYGRNPAALNSPPYDNPAFVMDTGGSFGVVWSTSGITGFHYDATAAAYTGVSAAASADTWHLAQVRWNSTTLEVRVDSGSWQTLAVDSANQPTTGALRVGKNWDGTQYLDGDIMEIGFAVPYLSDDAFNSIKTYVNARYSLAL